MKENIVKKIHDIRGSLNVISGFLRYLEKEGLGEEALEFHQACQRSLEKTEKALEELRALTVDE